MLPSSSKISFRSSLKTLAAVATVYSIFSVFPPSRPSPSYAFGSAPSSTRSPGEKPWSLDTPLVMAHRGGPGPGFPENCIETFNHSSQAGALLVEFDVRTTKDGHFVIIHDDNIARTTNGKGRVSDLPLSFLKTVHLKDPSGDVTALPSFRREAGIQG